MNRHLISTALALIAASVLATCVGCTGSGRPALASVKGRVTYQGKPVVEGQIIFQSDKCRTAIGNIGPDGSYLLTTYKSGDGAMPGRYTVTVNAMRSTGTRPKSPRDEISPDFKPGTIEWLVPEKFSRPETSTLTAEVKPGQNTIDFDL